MLGSRIGLLTAAFAAAAASAGIGNIIRVTDAPGLSQQTLNAIGKKSQQPIRGDRGTMQAMLGGGIGSPYSQRRRASFGWTDRHQRRVAKKKRNQARHRASCKG